jgi:hemerythrin-like domain-containing protein
MTGESPGRAGSLRALLRGDHQRLEELFVQLLEAFHESDWDELREMWSRFDAGLSAHLAAEERQLLPLFERVEPGEAAALLADHARFRRTLDDLGVGVDLHLVKLDAAQGFVEALRAHADREDQLLYRWADRALPESGQEAVARELDRGTPAERGEVQR